MTGFINGNLEDAIKGKRGFRSGRRCGPAGVLVGGRGGAPDAHGDDRVRAQWPRCAGSHHSRTCCPCPRGGFGQDTVLTRAWAAGSGRTAPSPAVTVTSTRGSVRILLFSFGRSHTHAHARTHLAFGKTTYCPLALDGPAHGTHLCPHHVCLLSELPPLREFPDCHGDQPTRSPAPPALGWSQSPHGPQGGVSAGQWPGPRGPRRCGCREAPPSPVTGRRRGAASC